jgi:predicted nuclease of predicted toxin-antitoxin system
MTIVVDENIPNRTLESLRAMGHTVIDVRGTPEEGIHDDLLWRKAQQERALLITTDKGFATKRNEVHFGVLVIRLRQPNRLKIHGRILQAISQFADPEWPGLIVVMRDAVQSVIRGEPPGPNGAGPDGHSESGDRE